MNIFICVCFSYETVHSIIPSPIHGHLSAIFMSENTWPKAADHARATFFFFFFYKKKKGRKRETKHKSGHSYCHLKLPKVSKVQDRTGVLYSVLL